MKYFKMTIKWGPILLGFDDDGNICGLWFEGQKYYPAIDEALIIVDTKNLNKEQKMTLSIFCEQMEEYEQGVRQAFDLPLKPRGTAFRKRVWDILMKVPFGKCLTYGEISQEVARNLGKESMSAQAVGGAVGHNPISIIIPCHRIIGKDGSMTGYAGGLDRKKSLLCHEGHLMVDEKIVN